MDATLRHAASLSDDEASIGSLMVWTRILACFGATILGQGCPSALSAVTSPLSWSTHTRKKIAAKGSVCLIIDIQEGMRPRHCLKQKRATCVMLVLH